jgi:hypothetical protein
MSGVYTPIIGGEGGINVLGLLDKVKMMPDIDNPEIFGMNDNADIAY